LDVRALLKEDFRRENVLAYDSLILRTPLQQDLHALTRSLIRACRAELEAGMYFSNGARSRGLPKVKEEAVKRCANV
jgi:hypothetical protein